MPSAESASPRLFESSSKSSDIWLFLYGFDLHASRLPTLLPSNHTSLPSHAVIVPNAFLSWDLPGLPYISPAQNSLIIHGVNDRDAKEWDGRRDGIVVHPSNKTGKSWTEEEQYRDYIHARCSPGGLWLPDLPPPVEGKAWLVPKAHVEHLIATRASPSSDTRPILLSDCRPFKDFESTPALELQDPSQDQSIEAWTFIAKDERRRPWLMPNAHYAIGIRTLALYHELSIRYMGHISISRMLPYDTHHISSTAHPLYPILPTLLPTSIRNALFRIPHGTFAGAYLIKALLVPFFIVYSLLAIFAVAFASSAGTAKKLGKGGSRREKTSRLLAGWAGDVQGLGGKTAEWVERRKAVRWWCGGGWWVDEAEVVTPPEQKDLIRKEDR